MAEATTALSILVIGGAEGAGLATTRALLRRGHKVAATACDSDGALAIRMAGALPVFPDLSRASAILSALRMTKAEALIHAGPQYFGGAPHASDAYAGGDQLVEYAEAVTEAATEHGIKRVVSLSFGYLYEAGPGAAKEGARDVHDGDYAPMLRAESSLRGSGLRGFIVRGGYIYGGASAETAALAEAIKSSRRLPAGGSSASWIHEDDLAAAIVALVEGESDAAGVETINAAAAETATPDEFCAALCQALGLNEPSFAARGFLSRLREETLRDKLMAREALIDSSQIRERFGWRPRHERLESGMEATALVWRMKDALEPEAYYGYEDEARAAIQSFAYEAALPEAAAIEEEPAMQATAEAKPEPVKAAPPPPSAGPTPWNEDEAKRDERRRRALERKAKRAARTAGA